MTKSILAAICLAVAVLSIEAQVNHNLIFNIHNRIWARLKTVKDLIFYQEQSLFKSFLDSVPIFPTFRVRGPPLLPFPTRGRYVKDEKFNPRHISAREGIFSHIQQLSTNCYPY